MYLNREGSDAVISLIGSMNDPSGRHSEPIPDYESWIKERIDPMLAKDGKSGRIVSQVLSGSRRHSRHPLAVTLLEWVAVWTKGVRRGCFENKSSIARQNPLDEVQRNRRLYRLYFKRIFPESFCSKPR